MKLHKSIDVVVNLLKAVFHTVEPFLHIFDHRNNRSVVRLEGSDPPLHCGQARFDGFLADRRAMVLSSLRIALKLIKLDIHQQPEPEALEKVKDKSFFTVEKTKPEKIAVEPIEHCSKI